LPSAFQASTGISSGPSAFPFFIFPIASFTSCTLISHLHLIWLSILYNLPWVAVFSSLWQ
ncbi:hypothetical protein SK128_001152, partial [Halocaridina rubra]